jgi:sulfate adenylyltransferase subunit 2
VWQYLAKENIPLPVLYFSHKRRVFMRDGMYLAECDHIPMKPNEVIEEKVVRFRTIGDMTSTGAVLSTASNIDDIIQEVAASRTTERGGRADDKRSETSMEDRKKEGYF